MKKFFKRFFQIFLSLILLIVIVLFLTDNQYILKGVWCTYLKGETTANIDDYSDFANGVVAKSKAQAWPKAEDYNKLILTDTLRKELESFETIGFGVFKNGKIVYEEYWDGYSPESKTNSFSMAKTVTTMLIGAAIEDGYIESLDQSIVDFLPEYKGNEWAEKCTVGDLSAMTSGYDWKEDYYLPLNPTAKAYYGWDLESHIVGRDFIKEPGGSFEYLSGATQLLGFVLKRAIKQDISNYLSKKFWQPMGMEQDALWSKDSEGGTEKVYCCLHSNVRDFAKLGQLLMQEGNWKGQQLLDSAFVKKMVTPNYDAFSDKSQAKYGYSVWVDNNHEPSFYAFLGHLGQRILVIPSEEMVIVRLGKHKDERLNERKGLLPGTDIYYYIDEILESLPKTKLPEPEPTEEAVLEDAA